MIAVSLVLAGVLGALAGVHVYWAFGGVAGAAGAVPERDGAPLFAPSRAATLAVAAGLALAAGAVLARAGLIVVPGAGPAVRVGCWTLAALFGLRAVGDGRYVGFFKRVRATPFGRKDTWLYSPLCLAIALGVVALCLG